MCLISLKWQYVWLSNIYYAVYSIFYKLTPLNFSQFKSHSMFLIKPFRNWNVYLPALIAGANIIFYGEKKYKVKKLISIKHHWCTYMITNNIGSLNWQYMFNVRVNLPLSTKMWFSTSYCSLPWSVNWQKYIHSHKIKIMIVI